MVATDISEQALAVANLNAQRNGAEVTFYQGNWFTALPKTRFDLIISNPPYIDPTDPHLLHPALKHEPASALIAKDRGLADLRELVSGASQYLSKGGWLILEHGYDQSAEVCAMLRHYGYTSIQVRKDIAGNDRAAIAQTTGNQ